MKLSKFRINFAWLEITGYELMKFFLLAVAYLIHYYCNRHLHKL